MKSGVWPQGNKCGIINEKKIDKTEKNGILQ
jgi:hypothetical protein